MLTLNNVKYLTKNRYKYIIDNNEFFTPFVV